MEANSLTYCLFCRAGHEKTVVNALERLGYPALSPVVIKWRPVNGRLQKRPTRLLPGYVFFDAEAGLTLPWDRIQSIQHVLRILQYGDGSRALREGDQAFVLWLKRHAGRIDVSQVIQVGTKIQFIAGPLKEMGGLVVKVNKNRKQVAVDIGNGSIAKLVWCGIEYVEAEEGDKA